MAAVDPFESRAKPALVDQPNTDYDLDAVLAERDEKPAWSFTFGGQSFELPGRIDVIAIAAIDAGRLDEGFRRLLGEEQWQRLAAVDAVFDPDALENMLRAYGKHVGAPMGEPRASTPSSKNTAKK